MTKKRNGLAVLLLSLALLAAGCGQSAAPSSGSDGGQTTAPGTSNSPMTKEEGVFTFATSGEYHPFSYFKDGQLTGFDVEIGLEIAKRLGLEANPVTSPFSGIVTGVKEGRYDAAVASHTITKERLQQVDFSDSYYLSGGHLFTRPDSDIQSLEDLKGKEVAVALGTVYEQFAREHTDKIMTYDSDVTALRALEQGKHDAVITDIIVGDIAMQEQGFNIKASGIAFSQDEQGIAVRKGNEELLNKINEALKQMHEDGTYQQLSEKYFNRDISK
ncbi:ABC transporter substrate-binding protein [Brevibacillus sp. TJ4]|uniref:ABC transporter substrate-binding protein n=1 Tax=Brevibacillus sp. TJ4 TaxID=3234853 RepID=UPI0037D32040